MTPLLLVSAIGCALVGGVFFAFSTFIMQALARLPAAEGIRAMQTINVTVLNRWFLGVFLGSGVACALVVVLGLLAWHPARALAIAGGALYLLGALLVTIARNVPLNDALARSPDTLPLWTVYLKRWTAWNHVRTAAALAAAVLLVAALAGSP